MGSIAFDPENVEAMPIAVVGIGCRLPGGASSPEKLWDLLMRKQSARKETPPDRFNIDAFYHPDGDKNGTLNNRAGHFLDEDISAFDAPFFSISPAEAISMDPMQRILLEVTYEATESAGIPISSLAGTNTSCYVGCFTSDYDQIAKRDPELLPKYHSTGTGQAILSNRISYAFDLKGPSVTLDTACSSSLVAVHLACQSLRTGESKTAIVGATHAILNPDVMVGMTNLHFLSPDSKCFTFDSRANGYARGEGMAALILKPLSDAIRDGDTVRAVIRGTAVNSNGKGSGITLPSKEAQVSLIRSAYRQAGCDPAVTGFCEAHGTGTAAGDPLEAGAIGEVFSKYRPTGENGKLFVGSIKTNIGHLEGASGLAALVKVIMSLEKGVIAPNLWFEKGNPAIDFDGWRIRVPTEAMPWPISGLRRASVNGFGYGGTNSHVILDDAYHYMRERGLTGKHQTCVPNGKVKDSLKLHDSNSTSARRPRIFQLSAHEKDSLLKNAKLYAEYLASHTQSNDDEALLDSLAFTLGERRTKLEFASTIVAASQQELIKGLQTLTTARPPLGIPSIGFIFTGQGAQWFAMGRELIQYPIFAQSLGACSKAVQSFGASWSLLDELLKGQKESRINEAEISQPLCSALQLSLVDLYASWNVFPTSVVGHSSGEIAAAYATGALTLESAMCAAYFRGLLSSKIKTLNYSGGMMAAGLSEKDALEEIKSMGDDFGKIVVACINSPRSVTLSGDLTALTQMQKLLTSRDIFARKLAVDTAYHSHHMQALAEEYQQCMSQLEVIPWAQRKEVTMFSSVTGREITQEDNLGPDYWVENMVSCVRFSDSLAGLCMGSTGDKEAKNIDFLLELGPHAALAGPVKQILTSRGDLEQNPTPIQYLSALWRGKDAAVTALTAAGSLLTQGYPTDLHEVNFPHGTPKTGLSVLSNLPSYSWNHERTYWSESRFSRDYRFRPFARTDLLGAPLNDWNPMEPRWRNFIRLSEQPWVRSHVVQGAIVYPAAGYCCMALEAASQLNSLALEAKGEETSEQHVAEYQIRNLVISRALLVPATDEGVEVIFSLRANPTHHATEADQDGSEFRIFSYTTTEGWMEHCRGLVSVVYRSRDDSSAGMEGEHELKFQQAQGACKTSIARGQLYSGLDAVGLFYGPEFQGITDLSAGNNQTVGTVQVTDSAIGMPKGFQFNHLIHPSTLDTFLQMSIAALSQGDMSNLTQAYVPTEIQEMRVSGGISLTTGHKLQVTAEARPHGIRAVQASVTAMAEVTKEVVLMRGIKLAAMASSAEDRVTSIPSHTAIAVWEPDVDLLTKEKMNQVLRASVDSSLPRPKDFELLAYYYFDRVLNEVSEAEVQSMHSHHQKFFRYMQHQRDLVVSHEHELQNEDWTQLSEPHIRARLEQLITDFSAKSDYEGRMFVRMGEALVSVLRKEVEPLALMMEDNLLYDYYTVALRMDRTYPQVKRFISVLSHKYPDLDYLEIGAGTGGCTTPVLEALSGTSNRKYPRMKSYTYTDISSGFFEQAAEKFSSWGDMIEYAKLDIEQDPETQAGFKDRRFDVIVAANVLHATYDINRTIKHARKLLRPGGKLVLLDMTHSVPSVSLIFGNLSGWWNCSEPWREYGPLLSEGRWQEVFLKHDFTDFQASSPDVLNPLEEQTRVMIATAIEPRISLNGDGELPRTLIVTPNTLSTESGLIEAIQSKLNENGISSSCCTLEETRSRNLSGFAIISFAELDNALLSNISPNDLAALQHIIQESAGLVWITRGGSPTKGRRPELSLFHGLARSLRAERENMPCITLDLDVEQPLPSQDAADLILRVFEQSFGPKSEHGLNLADREFCEEEGILRIKRAIENSRLDQLIASQTRSITPDPELQDVWETPRHLQLKIKSPGNLESLAFDDDAAIAAQLPADYVQIQMHAVGLNSKDVRTSLGETVDDYIGNECAGVITHIGAAVDHVKVGDRVAVWCEGAFSTTVRTRGNFVQRIPGTMSYSTAASLPLAYVTAYYGLVSVARIQKEDSVLINAATTSIGQAAIQIAKLHGAHIFATVSSEERKRHLIEMYQIPESHVLIEHDFAMVHDIRQATNDRGVNIVLNSLTGKALQAACKTVAPFGHFVDISDGNKPELARNITFTAVDISSLYQERSELAADIFSKIMQLVRDGEVRATSPLLVQPLSKIQDSMRLASDSQFEDKIILEPRSGDLVSVIPKTLDRIVISEDATYLLSGGLGGLGRSISRWMVRKGARNLIYVSRRGASSLEAAALISELNSIGVRTEVIECDITDEKKLSQHLSKALETLPPIKGVIQGAMVLQDQIFSNMSYEAFANCLRPKVQGSWSLHQATLQQPLEFFVLLSSCASVWGNAGQSNYAAGCTYQGALAAHRRALGLPATSIEIGKVANVGFVAENAGTTSELNLIKLGLLDISEEEFLAMLELAMLPSKYDEVGPGYGGNVPNGHLLTGLSSSNDPTQGEELPFWSRDPVFSHMDFVRPHLRKAKKGEEKDSEKATQQSLATLLGSATSIQEAERYLLDALLQKLARALMMPLEEMDAQKKIVAYGVDSLVAVELRNWFSREAQVDVSVFDIVQSSSLSALANKTVVKSPLLKAK